MIKTIATKILKTFGWKVSFSIPPLDKCVLIGAPHTSNWDFPLALIGMLACGMRFNWVGKHTMFKGPLGPFMRAIGGIAVDRQGSTGFIKKVIDLFNSREHFVMAIAPEGTRSLTKEWKEGFYRIALAAKVPIALAYIDYPHKQIGIERILEPSGDIEADFLSLEEYYRDKVGKYPEQQGPVRVKGLPRKKS